MTAILTATYIILSVLAALVFYSACVVASRGDSGEEEQPEPEQEKQHGNT